MHPFRARGPSDSIKHSSSGVSPMHHYLGTVMGLFGVLAWSGVSAQQQACTLLTPADIEAITGTKEMGEPHPTDMVIPAGPQKGQKMNGCMWGVAGMGMVSV